jgi:4-amino-4-deoxy-L-arabinose transferase-like glycosyltransferase
MSTENRQLADAAARRAARFGLRRRLALPLLVLFGILATVLLYQIPARHPVDIGGYDAAYVQGFHEPLRATMPGETPELLAGSDGSGRWTQGSSVLLFPQSGLPGTVSLHLRGWRPDARPVPVQVWLNGRQELARFDAGPAWQEYRLEINGGLLKASDFFVEIRSPTFRVPGDERDLGVLIDRVEYRVAGSASGLIMPYPSQLLYGGLAALLIWLLLEGRWARWRLPAYALLAVAFVLLYRLQPPFYPYPLRWLLPGITLLLAGLLALRLAPSALLARANLWRGAAAAVLLLWTGLMLRAQQQHVTLSLPGVEGDFRVFALRSIRLFGEYNPAGEYNMLNDGAIRADGFYNLGYPLLLWALRPFTADNAFLAARLISVCSGALLLAAGYLLAYRLLPERLGNAGRSAGAFSALLLLAFSPLVVQYGLYLGSDMPFAALTTLAIALLLGGPQRSWRSMALAGFVAGCAFLVRHIGLLLLLWGLVFCVFAARNQPQRRLLPLAFGLAFGLAAAPQLIVNTLQTGQPLFNQQAKNAWLGTYGGTDWDRWDQVSNDIGLLEVVLYDPPRFVRNWVNNVTAFVGQGAEHPGEAGRADQLRLLAFPANWLAVLGLPAAVLAIRRERHWLPAALLIFVAIYVAVLSVAFTLLRFYLPLAPMYAAGAAWLLALLAERFSGGVSAAPLRNWLAITLLILVLLGGNLGIGMRTVLDNQSAALVSVVRMVEREMPPDARMIAFPQPGSPIATYSVLDHRNVELPLVAPTVPEAVQAAIDQGADYMLWDLDRGPAPLIDPAQPPVATSGGYALYRLPSKR